MPQLHKETPTDAEHRERLCFLNQMLTKSGRDFVWRTMRETALLANPLHENGNIMGFNVGKQDLGRWLFAKIEEHCPELYPLMVKEAKEAAKNDDPNRNARPDDDADSLGTLGGTGS